MVSRFARALVAAGVVAAGVAAPGPVGGPSRALAEPLLGPTTVAGCTAVDCDSAVADDTRWTATATEGDAAPGVFWVHAPRLRWRIPNDGPTAFTLSAPAVTGVDRTGSCAIYDASGASAEPMTVAPGDHAYVVCSTAPDGWPSDRPAELVTLEVTIADEDTTSPLSTTAWVDDDLAAEVTATGPATLVSEECSAGTATGVVQFSLTVHPSTGMRALGYPQLPQIGLVGALTRADGLTVDLVDSAVLPGQPRVAGSQPAIVASPNDGSSQLGLDPLLGAALDNPPGPHLGLWLRTLPAEYTDRLWFEIPVTFDPSAPVGPLELDVDLAVSGAMDLGLFPLTVSLDCQDTSTTVATSTPAIEAPTTTAAPVVEPTTTTSAPVAPATTAPAVETTTTTAAAATTTVAPAGTTVATTTPGAPGAPGATTTTTTVALVRELPRTGSSPAGLALVGVLLVGLGGAATLATRRR